MRISAIRELFNPELKKVEDSSKKTEPSKRKLPASDSTELSQNAKRLSNTKSNLDIVAIQVNNSPEIRPEKIEEVKQKISDGFYNTPEFTDKLAEKLAQDLGIKKT
jgi:anti-sigma28 factor (negative regulator of flagellin synthesis)